MGTADESAFSYDQPKQATWWLIPLSKWVITPVINGINRVNPLIIGVITHLLSGMGHQVLMFDFDDQPGYHLMNYVDLG